MKEGTCKIIPMNNRTYQQKHDDFNNGKYEVEYILAQKSIELSEVVYWYLFSLVPEGRLTRDEDVEISFEIIQKINTNKTFELLQ